MKINKIVIYTIILFIGYGLIQFIPMGGIKISIPVIHESSNFYSFDLPLSTLLDILLAPPFLIIMFYYIYKAITTNPLADNSNPNERKGNFIKFLLFGSGVVLVSGIIMHGVANYLNGLVTTDLGDPLYVAIYWFDEVVGHKLIHLGIFAFLIGCFVIQFWHRIDSEFSKFDWILFPFFPSAIGIVYSISAIEGQAGFDLWVISIISIIVILYVVKFRGLKLRENIFTYFVLIFFISLVISTIVYGFITGFVPGYPFFKQPSTL